MTWTVVIRIRQRTLALFGAALIVLAAVAALYLALRPAPRPPRQPAPVWPTHLTTLAGAGAPGFLEGRGVEAAFSDPFGVVVDARGNTYVADAGDNNAIWRIESDGSARLVAGGREGFADGHGRAAAFNTPSGLAIDRAGNLIVADTANNAIRRVAPNGEVTTLAGNGEVGSLDGPAGGASFNGPIGVVVAPDGGIIVADTYNDRVRRIAPSGEVTTIAGGTAPGFRDGTGQEALFDTPSGVAVDDRGVAYVADTGNDAIRRIDPDGHVTTVGVSESAIGGTLQQLELLHPAGIAVAKLAGAIRIFVSDAAGRIVMVSPSGDRTILAGRGSADGNRGTAAPLRNPAGVAVAPDGTLRVADSDNYLVRRLTRPGDRVQVGDIDLTPPPLLTARTLGVTILPWPVDPQQAWHEVAATLGEARGSLNGDGRERLHTGIDVQAPVGARVRAVLDEKVRRPIPASGFGTANEAIHLGVVAYVHVRVGRTPKGRPLDPMRFTIMCDETGRPSHVRIRRGTRFAVGDLVGSVNRFAHVHLAVGPSGAEINPLSLAPAGFRDQVPPAVSSNGIVFYTQTGDRIGPPEPVPPTRRTAGSARAARTSESASTGEAVRISGRVTIVVEAFDRVDDNKPNRRLGVYALGYQVLREDGTPASGFEEPGMTIRFDRLPADPEAAQLLYAEGSGITVYGSRATRFRYVVTNWLRDGETTRGTWDTSQLTPGNYRLRVIAQDQAGNTTTRDVRVTVSR